MAQRAAWYRTGLLNTCVHASCTSQHCDTLVSMAALQEQTPDRLFGLYNLAGQEPFQGMLLTCLLHRLRFGLPAPAHCGGCKQQWRA